MITADKILYRDEVYQIVACALEVLGVLGHGWHEKAYENALAVEFQSRGIPCLRQCHYDLAYKGIVVGEFIPDLIVYNEIVIDTKTIPVITDRELGKMINYLKVTRLTVGLIINFHNPKLEWKRIVHTASLNQP